MRGTPYDNSLTSRQFKVIELILSGKLRKEIAYELGIAPKSVDVHASSAYRKLGIRSKWQLRDRFFGPNVEPIKVKPQNRDNDIQHIITRLETIEQKLDLALSSRYERVS